MLELMLLFGALAVLPMFFDGRDNDGDTETEAPDTGGGEDGGEGGGNGGGNGGGGYVEGMDPIYAGDRSFDGTNGNDRIFTDDYYLSETNGRAWSDSLYGGAGNDRLGAGYGDDLIDGGGGSDQLDGWLAMTHWLAILAMTCLPVDRAMMFCMAGVGMICSAPIRLIWRAKTRSLVVRAMT